MIVSEKEAEKVSMGEYPVIKLLNEEPFADWQNINPIEHCLVSGTIKPNGEVIPSPIQEYPQYPDHIQQFF
jgi:hypothetical protein